MADISKINGVPIANIEKLDAVLAANIAKVNGLVFSTAAAFLLDTYTGAAAGYSTRRLASSATVLMRVRRETAGGTGDDDEADVAYDSNNELSLDSAISNASAGVTATTLGQFLNVGTVNGTTYTNPDSLTVTASCFVDEWKDQSGNANHAEQTAQASQPQIHSGTVNTDLILENGKPALDASNKYFSISYGIPSPFTFTSVIKTLASGNRYIVACNLSPAVRNINGGFNMYPGNHAIGTTLSTQAIYAAGYDSSNGVAYGRINSVETVSSTTASAFSPASSGALLSYVTGSAGIAGPAQEIIIWSNNQRSAGNIAAIESDINSEFLIYQPTDAPTSGLLATYTGAAAAYSVRQLSDKAVIALRIRRDSDDEETNIGWDANGDLDTTAISDFCSTANGYVTRWWDQSTNGNHADQATDASQPQIYNGTAVITENGKPALECLSPKYFTVSSGATQPFTQHIVCNPGTGTPQFAYGDLLMLRYDSGGTTKYHDGSFKTPSPTFTNASGDQNHNMLFYYGATTGYAIQNQSSHQEEASVAFTALRTPTQSLGGKLTSGGVAALQEFIIWNNDQYSNRTGIESNVNTYFSIY